ncbi:MAG: UDP-phosphate galactose phosphotransferase [Pseudomonadales bacterium]|nr:UDP-phosphate galactose phosphotransferase [Pseudomonadales bacterium]
MFHIRIFNHYVPLQYVILALVEYWVLVFSVYLAHLIRLPEVEVSVLDYNDPTALKTNVFAVVMLCCTLALGVYEAKIREGFSGVAVRSVVAFFLLGCGSLTVLYYLFPQLQLGRGLLTISAVSALALCVLVRALFFLVVDSNKLRRRILVWGNGTKAAEVVKNIQDSGLQKYLQVVGLVGPSPNLHPELPAELLMEIPGGLAQYCKQHKIDEIIVALDERRRELGGNLPLDELMDCKLSGIEVMNSLEFCEREIGRIELKSLDPSWMLFSDGFRYSGLRDATKRVFDILISLVLIAVAWPFSLLTALAVFLDDGTPVLYRQTRVGLNGKCFDLYKFRSMRKDAEKNGAVWAQKNDNRVTRVGAFIRNTRLDELPQIYNVLRGDMSFVGPRPERPEFVKDLEKQVPFYSERHRVKPGLMGWAQLKYPYGASVEDASQKLRYDLYYTKNHSLLLDILIVIQTVEVVLLGKGVR